MNFKLTRRQMVQAGAALGTSAVFSPSVLAFAQGETPVKIGMHDPLTGTYAAEGESEVRGARMALAEINGKGGILGREAYRFDQTSPERPAPERWPPPPRLRRGPLKAGLPAAAVSAVRGWPPPPSWR